MNDCQQANLQHAIEHAAHLLPAQGPITVFIHHNTLHAFEDLPFTEAVKKAAALFNSQPYLSEERYREELRRGRIRFSDVQAVVREDLGAAADDPLPLCTRSDLRRAMLKNPLRHGPTEELVWFVAETDALRHIRQDISAITRGRLIAETRRWVMRDLRGRFEGGARSKGQPSLYGAEPHLSELLDLFRDSRMEEWNEDAWERFTLQALWRVCCDGVANVPDFVPEPPLPIRHRDLLLRATGEDADNLIHDVLIRFCAAFLDQGFAPRALPDRRRGFYRVFCDLYRAPAVSPEHWMRALAQELSRLEAVAPLDSIRESLAALGVPSSEWDDFISATLLALPGWGGMINQVKVRGDAVRQPIPHGSLIEFLAIRLLLDRFALIETAKQALDYVGPLSELRSAARQRIKRQSRPSTEQRAFTVFQLAQVLGWTPAALHVLDLGEWMELVKEIETFSELERRRLLHLAYERRFVTQSLDALALHSWRERRQPSQRPRFQVSFCLDDREESIRRHLEEVAPHVETFGIAGFYGVAMYYRGAADAHFVPLCPIVIKAQHWVTEKVVGDMTGAHARRARMRRALGTLSHQLHLGSRTFAAGALLTASIGVLASIPLTARVLFPRLTARVRRLFGRVVQAPRVTQLSIERTNGEPGPSEGHFGYTVDEMTEIAERQLRDIGLTRNFARLVFLNGHGSASLNNPHRSAYDCGACGGSPGAANGRALARMLNDARVREQLATRGLVIPSDTVFVGGFHNTCNDTITLFDLDGVPESHRQELEEARQDFDLALKRNAHERCRRFMSAPLTLSFDQAWEHVEQRSEDLAQTRPELGHATNALCIVGRRNRTRGLFLDRRAFLTTYDPTQDDAQGTILARLLSAAVPVCAGINLEYYFSRVDNDNFGCGTKLPHNVSALVGVMNGPASDLRTGLPLQMIEIHEPVRLLFVIESKPDAMLGVMERNTAIGRVFRNGWSLLALQDPDTGAVSVYRDGEFHPYRPEAERVPQAPTSLDWYRGWRDHLEFAEIG